MRKFLLLIALLIAPLTCIRAEMGFGFVPTFHVLKEKVTPPETGPFGVPFIAEPAPRFYPHPTIPKPLRKDQSEGFVRAALKVGKDGRVIDVKILEANPVGVVEESALKFFQRVVYKAQEVGEFETDAILLFRKK